MTAVAVPAAAADEHMLRDDTDDELILNYDNNRGGVSHSRSSSNIIVPVDFGRLFVYLQTVNANVARIWLQRHTDGVRVDATGDGRQLVCFDIPHELLDCFGNGSDGVFCLCYFFWGWSLPLHLLARREVRPRHPPQERNALSRPRSTFILLPLLPISCFPATI